MLIIGSFTGVVFVAISKMIVKPEVQDADTITTPDTEEESDSTYLIGVICGIFSGMCFSLLRVATRKL
jgi:hypothetical protein